MRQLIEKVNWDKFRIRSRKDWVIFWIFAVLICYAVGQHYDYKPDRWLFPFANPYMTDINQPHAWGQMIPFLTLLAAVAEAVLFLCKKPVRAKVLVLAGVLLMPMLILAGYRIHTNLIVSSLWKEEPEFVRVRWSGADPGKGNIDVQLEGEERQEMLELCRSLVPISDAETQNMLTEWHHEDNTNHFMEDDSVYLRFAEKYGHNYSFTLRLCDGKLYIWRGYGSSQKELITFFEDAGISGRMEEIIGSAALRAEQNRGTE